MLLTKGTLQTETETFTTTGPGDSGSLQLDDGAHTSTVNYQNLGIVDLTGTTAPNLVFNLPAGAQATLQDSGTPTDGVSQIVSTGGPAFATTIFNNPSTSLTANTAGNSNVQLAAMDNGFAPATETFSGSSSDTFQLTSAGAPSPAPPASRSRPPRSTCTVLAQRSTA